MTSSSRTASLVSEFLGRMDNSAPPGQRGRKMLERRLRLYLWWKAKLGEKEKDSKGKATFHMPQQPKDFDKGKRDEISEALKKKDAQAREKAASRRRVRGGGPPTAGPSRQSTNTTPGPSSSTAQEEIKGTGEMMDEAEDIAEL